MCRQAEVSMGHTEPMDFEDLDVERRAVLVESRGKPLDPNVVKPWTFKFP